VPKAVYRSGCPQPSRFVSYLEGCGLPRGNSNLGSFTQQSDVLLLDHCDRQSHTGVNNLPKVVNRQRDGQRPSSRESNALITKLLSHPLKKRQQSYPDIATTLTLDPWYEMPSVRDGSGEVRTGESTLS